MFYLRLDEQVDGGDFAGFHVGFGFLAIAALDWGTRRWATSKL